MQAATTTTETDDIVRIKLSTLIDLSQQSRRKKNKPRLIRASRSGNYLSNIKGRGMEFDESRPYQPGDDIRAIDWRVTARTGRTHTKIYREEKERPVLLWVDYRPSMFFGTQLCYKSVLAAKVAAILAWNSASNGDRLGGLIFSADNHVELRPKQGKSATLHFIQQLASHSAWLQQPKLQLEQKQISKHNNAADQALMMLSNVTRPGSQIYMISDFRYLDKTLESHLGLLARHNTIQLIAISDPLEKELPPAGLYRFSDGVQQVQLDTGELNLRQQYQLRFDRFQQDLQDICDRHAISLLNLSTLNTTDQLQNLLNIN